MIAPRMIVIDDHPEIVELVRNIAEERGFEAHGIDNGASFKELYELLDPDAVVLDVIMPEVDGIEILNYLAARRSTALILILSGMGDSIRALAERYGEAQGLKIVGSIGKPVRIADLRDRLDECKRSLRADEIPRCEKKSGTQS